MEKTTFDDNTSSSFALLTLRPKETAVFYIMLSPLKSRASMLSPQIINKSFANYFKTDLSNEPMNVLTYLISGALLMMVFYSLAHYFLYFKTGFLYYSVYAVCTGFLLFLKSYFDNYTMFANYYFEGYFDFILQSTGLIFYIAFIREFLRSEKEPPFLERVFLISQYITIFSLLVFLAIEISGEKRRNIFLSVKEALNNVLRHSHASTVTINISLDEILLIEICDDGIGINNIKRRIESIDGKLCIQNNNGAKLIFTLQL